MCPVEALEKTVFASLFLFLRVLWVEARWAAGLLLVDCGAASRDVTGPVAASAPPRGFPAHPASVRGCGGRLAHGGSCPSLARFGCSDAPASHTAFGDHGAGSTGFRMSVFVLTT